MEPQKEIPIRIRADQRTHCSIITLSPLICLFSAAILSFLTIATTSWFLPDAADLSLVYFGLISGTIIVTLIAVTATVVCRYPASGQG